MDSLTQIVLGAAVGEATLGRKVGNRAMLWGAIGGTIPDLDVFANLATDPVSSLAY
ncbi:MAG: metal-dependent hydrolase, partial [Bacteroidota bacterium]